MFIPSRVLVFLSQYLILRGNYRKSIYWQFSNYRSNYWYLFITNLSYCWLKGIIGNIIDNENLWEIIVIKKIDLSPTPSPSASACLYLSACSGEMADMVVGMEDSCVEPGKMVLVYNCLCIKPTCLHGLYLIYK